MCERLKQAVLKTAVPERGPGGRIPLPPPESQDQGRSPRTERAVIFFRRFSATNRWIQKAEENAGEEGRTQGKIKRRGETLPAHDTTPLKSSASSVSSAFQGFAFVLAVPWELSKYMSYLSFQEDFFARANDAAGYIRQHCKVRPQIALVLGSGLGSFASELTDATVIPYSQIPHVPLTGAEGHAGNLVICSMGGVPVAAMQGRVHLYEGHSPQRVAFSIRVFARMGIKAALLTNAAGGVSAKLKQGCLVVLTDHINLQGVNPLIGPNEARFGPRFPDMKVDMVGQHHQAALFELRAH